MAELTQNSNSKKRKIIEPRSWCWEFFERIEKTETTNRRALCKECGVYIDHNDGCSTSSLLYHLSHVHSINKHDNANNKKFKLFVDESEDELVDSVNLDSEIHTNKMAEKKISKN